MKSECCSRFRCWSACMSARVFVFVHSDETSVNVIIQFVCDVEIVVLEMVFFPFVHASCLAVPSFPFGSVK